MSYAQSILAILITTSALIASDNVERPSEQCVSGGFLLAGSAHASVSSLRCDGYTVFRLVEITKQVEDKSIGARRDEITVPVASGQEATMCWDRVSRAGTGVIVLVDSSKLIDAQAFRNPTVLKSWTIDLDNWKIRASSVDDLDCELMGPGDEEPPFHH